MTKPYMCYWEAAEIGGERVYFCMFGFKCRQSHFETVWSDRPEIDIPCNRVEDEYVCRITTYRTVGSPPCSHANKYRVH
jgi:hypothetical protein